MTIQAAFGAALREIRTERGLSQEAVAVAAGLNRAYYNGVELGKRNVAIVNIGKLADALNLQPSVILARAERLRA